MPKKQRGGEIQCPGITGTPEGQTDPHLIKIRRTLGDIDSKHDFCNKGRIEKILENKDDAESIIAYLNLNIYNKISDLCTDIHSDEDKLLRIFYGTRSIGESFSRILKNDIATPFNTTRSYPYYSEVVDETQEKPIIIEYNDIGNFVEWLHNVVMKRKKYTMDYTLINEDQICELGDQVIVKTIATEYDRNTKNDASNPCIEIKNPIPVPTQTIPFTILSKDQGELLIFDKTEIIDVQRMKWYLTFSKTGGSIKVLTGIIDVSKIIAEKNENNRNLTLFVNRIFDIQKGLEPGNKTAKIKNLYGIDLDVIKNLYEQGYRVGTIEEPIFVYIYCLLECKKKGDLLLVKLANEFKTNLISNDRVTCVMSSFGYNIPTVRTSKGLKSGSEHSKRLVYLYNIPETINVEAMNIYYTSLINNYRTNYNAYSAIIREAYKYDSTITTGMKSIQDYKNTIEDNIVKLKELQIEAITQFQVDTDTDAIETDTGAIETDTGAIETDTGAMETDTDDITIEDITEENIEELLQISAELEKLINKSHHTSNDIKAMNISRNKLRSFRNNSKPRVTVKTNKSKQEKSVITRVNRCIRKSDQIITVSTINRTRTEKQIEKVRKKTDSKATKEFISNLILMGEHVKFSERVRVGIINAVQGKLYNYTYLNIRILLTLLKYFRVILTNIKPTHTLTLFPEAIVEEYPSQYLQRCIKCFNDNKIPLFGTVWKKDITIASSVSISEGLLQIFRTIDTINSYVEKIDNIYKPLNFNTDLLLIHYPNKNLIKLNNLIKNTLPTNKIIVEGDYKITMYAGVLNDLESSLPNILNTLNMIEQDVEYLTIKYVNEAVPMYQTGGIGPLAQSMAQGRLTSAQGRLTSAQGRLTSGQSMVQGKLTSAQGRPTSAQGRLTLAQSMVQGRLTSAQGRFTSAQGRFTSAQGTSSRYKAQKIGLPPISEQYNSEYIYRKESSSIRPEVQERLDRLEIVLQKIETNLNKILLNIIPSRYIYKEEEDVIDLHEVYLVKLLKQMKDAYDSKNKEEGDRLLVEYMEEQFLKKVFGYSIPLLDIEVEDTIKAHPVAFSKSVS